MEADHNVKTSESFAAHPSNQINVEIMIHHFEFLSLVHVHLRHV